jgi:N-acylneuraminate cytidylyltransferase
VNVAVIPARGGSKRIPRKNVRDFAGKPMIAWSIEAARRSGCFQRIVVSTDDEEIAAVAVRHGAEAPFRRPPELATDTATTLPVIAHAVEWLVASGVRLDHVCCIYPTAPLIVVDDLRRGLELLERSDADYVFACTTFPFAVQRALRKDPAGRVTMLHPEHENTRSQDLPETFHDAGQFYWGRARAWLEGRRIYGPGSLPLMIPRFRVQDIDTPEDWARAELIYRLVFEAKP